MKTYTTPMIADHGALGVRTNESTTPLQAREVSNPDLFRAC